MSHVDNFEHLELPLSEKTIDKLFSTVKTKLVKSGNKYGNTFWLNNVKKELNEELVDIIGWSTLQVLRLQHMAQSRFADLDKIYWEQFLSMQDTEFLETLKCKITEEIQKREGIVNG